MMRAPCFGDFLESLGLTLRLLITDASKYGLRPTTFSFLIFILKPVRQLFYKLGNLFCFCTLWPPSCTLCFVIQQCVLCNNCTFSLENHTTIGTVYCRFKGTVSRELRPRLLYIIRKLFSRPFVASLKIFILLKGQFAMYIPCKTLQRKLSWVILLYLYHVACAEKFVSTDNYFPLKAILRAITSR